ncbi:hypothetical protein ACRXCV_09390 [Halobacteriovorax sp. GFR7]|uniref:hypothetical protein n=1 Tax=unclassified Halobacteriovorax TaxID=2639665 RepID=UPI003D98BC3B
MKSKLLFFIMLFSSLSCATKKLSAENEASYKRDQSRFSKVLVIPRYYNAKADGHRSNKPLGVSLGLNPVELKDFEICSLKSCKNRKESRRLKITIETYQEAGPASFLSAMTLTVIPAKETTWLRATTVVEDANGNEIERFSIADGLETYYQIFFAFAMPFQTNASGEVVNNLIERSLQVAYDKKLI